MGFVEKLDQLIEKKGINKHVFAKESGIPYTTVLSWYERGSENIKLSTLRSLATYFNCTLDYLADDDVSVVVEDDKDIRELNRLYKNADPRIRRAVDSLLKGEQ